MIVPWTTALAVVQLPTRPSGRQVLLSYLPAIAVAVGLVILTVLLRRAAPALFKRMPRRARVALLAVIVAGLGAAVAIPMFRGRAAPPVPTAASAGDGWLTFMGSVRRTGQAGALEASGPARPKKLWTYRDPVARAPFAAPPAVAAGRVFAGSDNRKLYCFHAQTGDVLWTFKAAAELFGSPVVSGDRVYLGEGLHHTADAKLYCLDVVTGRKLWEFATRGHVEFSPTLFDGRLYVAAGGDGIYCLDAASGAQLWRYPGPHVDLSPAVSERGVFFGGFWGEAAFYALDPKTGELRWKRPAPTGVSGSPSTDGRRVYFGLGNGTFGTSHANPVGSVACLGADDGNVLWTFDAKDAVLTAVAVDRGKVYFGSRDGNLYCLDAETGRKAWAFDAGEPVLSSPALGGGRVYFGCDDGQVYCLDAATGAKVWTYDASQLAFNSEAQVIASPALAGGRLYVGCMNFVFFCLGDEDDAAAGAAARPSAPATSPAGR